VAAGVTAARAVLADPARLADDDLLALANDFEGHPDNAAAALFGGATVAWTEASGTPRAARLELHPELTAVVCVPAAELPTAHARMMLPPQVPHVDAAFNAGRAALLTLALSRRPDLLLPATEDRLHQGQRGPAMPGTERLLQAVRAHGGAAVVSGAGPGVLVLGAGSGPADAVAAALADGGDEGWQVLRPGIDTRGAFTATEGDSPDR
jgi:homoserine kinase